MVDYPVPIIKFELQGLRHTIMTAIVGKNDELNKLVESAVHQEITVEAMNEHIRKEVRSAVKEAVTNSIRQFLVYGEGGQYIRESAKRELSRILNDMGIPDEN